MEIYKVGDEVYHIDYGWGIVKDAVAEEGWINVQFERFRQSFTSDGRISIVAKHPTLSFTEYTLINFSQERLIILPEVGELCLVSDDGIKWEVDYFSYYDHLPLPFVTHGDSWRYLKRIKLLD